MFVTYADQCELFFISFELSFIFKDKFIRNVDGKTMNENILC